MRTVRIEVFIALNLLAIAGCGGGGNGSSGGVAPAAATKKGSATFKVTWPVRTRLVPAASNSINIVITQGTTVIAQTLLPRPSSGGTSSASFSVLPVGTFNATATAYPNTDGTGTAQATATAQLIIQAGQNTSIGLTMNSTIDHLTLAPNPATVTVGTALQMYVTAYDVNSNVVLLSSPKLTWASSKTNIATVDGNGVVSGLISGSPIITVTDTESGKTASETITSRVISPITFATPVIYNTIGTSPNEVMVADFDGDGNMDIVVGTSSDEEILYGNANGTFQPAQMVLTWTGGVSPFSVSDMNGDGKPDLTCGVTNGFIMIPNLGRRKFGSPTLVPVNNQVGQLVTASFTNGGFPDVAIIVHDHVGETSTDIFVYKNSGGGNFTQVSTITNGWIILDISAGNLRGTGNTDLIASITTDEVGTSGTSIYFGDGTGHFTSGGGVGTATSNVDETVIADFLGNGLQDYAVANDTQGNLSVVMNSGGGAFATLATYGGLSRPDHIRAADLDGDGKPEIIVENRDAQYFTVLHNSNGLFQNQIQFPSGGACEPIAVADVNKDGKPDVIISFTYSNQIAIVLNTTLW